MPYPTAVIGLDGATWDVILPLVHAGRLPTLARLMEEGAWAPLRSVQPPLSPPAWTAFMTGCNPGKTRIYDFVGRTEDGGFRLVNGNRRAVPSLWRLLGDAGVRVAVVNVPMTYPPEPVNGVIIAGMDAPVKDRPITYPAELAQRLRAAGLRFRVEVHPAGLITQDPDAFTASYVNEVNRMTAEQGTVVRWLWREEQPDFLMVAFVNTDRIGHAAGRHLKDFQHPERVAALPDDHPIVAAYRTADLELSRVLEVLPPHWTVMVMSDHGFQPYDYVFNLNFWLKERGWLSLDEGKLRPSRLGRLAPLWQRIQYRLGGYAQANLLQRAALFRAVDWARTRAYSFGAFGSIFINLRGRDPYGIVAPGGEYERVCQELAEDLLALRDPQSGQPIVKRVTLAREVYSGPYVDTGPDLLIETMPGYFIRNSLDDYQPRLLYPAGRYGARSLEHTGMHGPQGVLIACGPAVAARGRQPPASILDLAPTVLALYGVPIPEYVDGCPLTGWLDPAAVSAVGQVAFTPEPAATPESAYNREEEALVEQHLRELGYL